MGSFWQGKPWQAFKNFAILFSFITNFVLLLVLLAAAPLIIPIVNDVAEPIVGGLNGSFVEMGEATIERTIQVNDSMPISFTLPLNTSTSVTTTQAVKLNVPAQFVLPDGGGIINGNVAIELPKDLVLPVQLKLNVPVDQVIPVSLAVGVSIPLAETELGRPFYRLQGLFAPLDELIRSLPSTNEELIDRILDSSPAPSSIEQTER